LTPEQLQFLRSQLPPFGEEVLSTPELHAFNAFYEIDFAVQLPGVSHNVGHVNSGPYQLAVHRWQQPEALANLFIVHGYYDHTGLFGKLVEWGLRHQCNVVIFDLPGHGLSTGAPAVIQNFREYGDAISDVLTHVTLPDLPLWTMGQSAGCAALIEFARANTWPFSATVLLAPLIRPMGWSGVRFAHTALKPFVKSIVRKFATNTGDKKFLAFVQSDPLQCHHVPLDWITALRRWLAGLRFEDLGVGQALVVQGDHDHTVDWKYNVGKIQALFPDSRVAYLKGAGHQLANETDVLRENYFAVVMDYLSERGVPLTQNAQS
jgi:alpha-beta hydrolase superfamily lysophospholipase